MIPSVIKAVKSPSLLAAAAPEGVAADDALRAAAEHYCAHEFNVLGSGWRRVYHGMECAGFEGKRFPRGADYPAARRELPATALPEHDRLMALARQFHPGYVPIDWQLDFKSGFRWNGGAHHTELKYGLIEGVDAKVSADLGRCYHLVILARAWRAFGEERYRAEAVVQTLDWLASNPCERGAGWRACMNVAIRAANLVALWDILGYGSGRE